MRTAVQLRAESTTVPRSELLYGAPCEMVDGKQGPVALFAPDALVGYLFRSRRRAHLFVFRTLMVDDRLATLVPGVHPRVRLLVDVRSVARVRLIRSLFRRLLRDGQDPTALPDGFYLRVGVAVSGRLRRGNPLDSLAAHSAALEIPWTS
jgi:hypothetical protein